MWHFTADWHLNHINIIKYCNRPFLTEYEKATISLAKKGCISLKSVTIDQDAVKKMNNCIIESTNNTVTSDDTLVILGDFCWSSTTKKDVAEFFDRINCKNIYLIFGNHDNRKVLSSFFKAIYDHHVFSIEKQNIFTSHYPCRSWPSSNYGSWMLYGHVHNKFKQQDDCVFSLEEKETIKNRIEDLIEFKVEPEKIDTFVKSMQTLFLKNNLTLDVGVDNIREEVPFGTPWSFNDIKFHMEKKLINE